MHTLHPVKKGSAEDSLWIEEKAASLMPSYWEVLQTELYFLLGERDYFLPPSQREGGPREYPWLGQLLSFVLFLCPVGHVITLYGRFTVALVFRKFGTFVHAALGHWSPYAAKAYEVEKKAQEMGDGVGDEHGGRANSSNLLTNCMMTIIAPRAILAQLVPQLVFFSIFAIAASSSPLFVEGELQSKISRLFVLDCFAEAERRELQQHTKQVRAFRWIIALSGISIFILESRAIVFSVNVYMVFLAIYAIFQPVTKTLIGATVVILLPVAFAHSLRLVMMLGRAMNIKDVWDLKSNSNTTTTDILEIVRQ